MPRRNAPIAKITLDDVAAAAKVSPATVSRALNRPDLVRGELRDRINGTIAALGYVPHGPARALASSRSRTLGAVVPTLNNTIFARTIDAFGRRLEQAGYVLLLTTSEYDYVREFIRARALVERGVDGLMLVGHRHEPGLYELIAQKQIPFINSWASPEGAEHPAIGYDGRAGGELAAGHLLDLGHRELGIIMGDPSSNDRMEERLAGITAVMQAHGLRLREEQIVLKTYSIEGGREGVRELWARGLRPTAILGGNDILAAGALFECLAQGVAVPKRMSIIGFGDLDISAQVTPGLTTVHNPQWVIGEIAAEYLLARIEGREPPPLSTLELKLVVRSTTAAPSSEQLQTRFTG